MSTIVKLLMSVVFLATTSGFAHAADWPHTRFDAADTSFNPHERILGPSNVGDLEILWTNSSPCTIRQGVSVTNGVVYYGHYCGEFRAVDAATGAMLWTKSLDGKDSGHAVVDGVAYVASIGAVYAFDASTGATLWTWDPGAPKAWDPVVANGVVYVGTDDGVHHLLDASSGIELMSLSPGGPDTTAVTDSAVYILTADTLRVYSTGNLALLWTGLLPEGQGREPVVANGVVYVHSDAGIVYAFDANGCGQEVCAPLWRGLTQVQTAGDGTRPPTVDEGTVYVGANSTFYAFPAGGCGAPECVPLWTKTVACPFFSGTPSVANGVAYSPCGNNYLYAFDASTGDMLWEYFTSGSNPIRSSPAIVDGRLYHDATFNFTLYAFHVPSAPPPPPEIGGSVTGMEPVIVACRNLTTLTRGFLLPLGTKEWSCATAGLQTAPGEIVLQSVFGLADDSGAAVGGAVSDMELVLAVCENKSLPLEPPVYILAAENQTAWDCEAEGLTVSPDDGILQHMLGVAEEPDEPPQ